MNESPLRAARRHRRLSTLASENYAQRNSRSWPAAAVGAERLSASGPWKPTSPR